MVDQPAKPGLSDIAVNGLTNARLAVEAASEQVDDVGRRFKKNADSARKSGSFSGFIRGFLEDRTRAAPLAMLGLAFIAGAIFVRRR